MARPARNPVKPWMVIYFGLVAAVVLAGRPAEVVQQEAALPLPAIVGTAPILRKDI